MVYHGNPVSEGIALGKVLLYEPFVPDVKSTLIEKDDVQKSIDHYENARSSAKAELEIIQQMLKDDPEKAKIMAAHMDILFDVAMDEEIRGSITFELKSAETAVNEVYGRYIKIIGRSKDELIRERAADLQDVKRRLLRNCMGIEEKNLAFLAEPSVIVAHDLFPSDTASMNRKNVLAIVTEEGGPTSHTAILARSYEIPALLGVKEIRSQLQNGQQVIVDAVDGCLLTEPTDVEQETYEKKRALYLRQAADTKKYLGAEAVTKDGVKIEVELNIGSANVQEIQGMQYTSGVGLFRTEFLYMGRNTLPTEEEQVEIYRKVLMQAGKNPVTVRTLDIGGDKKVDSLNLPKEDNPFLGNRALRLCFDRRDIFKTQLRAVMRAGTIGNLWVMFPMVGSLDDVRNAMAVVHEVQNEMDREGVSYGKNIKFGIMIEIPSIALIADLAAKEVDFASIGTNDLCQYTTAVDRLNPTVAKYYQSYHPAMFRLIGYVVEQFNKQGKPICVCGELGGDKLAAPVLLGLGMRRLSMGIASVARIKKIITQLDVARAKTLAENVCRLETAEEIESYLKTALADIL